MNFTTSRALGSALALLAVGVMLPGCFTVGDDDSGKAGQAGDKGSGGKGGTGGTTGGTGGTTGGTSGSGGTGGTSTCITSGNQCSADADCCAFTETNGYCIDGTCTDGCTTDADCTTGCCAPLENGGSACGPKALCCKDDGEACGGDSDCCSALDGMGYCVTGVNVCAPTCKSPDDCASGCCALLDNGDSVCAPVQYCN